MFSTYDMNPIAIRKMEEEKMKAMEKAGSLSFSCWPWLASSFQVVAAAVRSGISAWWTARADLGASEISRKRT
ncbi:hypothetical protein [Nioella aestuarii]|uniref:hypothetical protein n=1 Tax=Nioella aestuarii TaxID=1662864 RepID=UPI003D7FF828